MAAFLFVAGITGSILAFNSELERVFAPQLFAEPARGMRPLDLATLAERADAIVPNGRAEIVSYADVNQVKVDFLPRIDPATNRQYNLGFDEFFIDPWTGKELGRRIRGDLSQGVVNLMPFIYDVHWTLFAGSIGQWILGSVALLWTLDCFVGFYLTLPRRSGGFWPRWRHAWWVKWRASPFRVNFDLHRASGLWLWATLFIFAWSSVMMNIRPVYERVMYALFDYESITKTFYAHAHHNETPRLNWHDALNTGQRLMAEQSRQKDFRSGQPIGLAYFAETGAYLYEVRGSRDLFERAPKGGGTAVMFDGDTGELRSFSQPTGERLGNTLESWLYALHMARIFGRAYQVFVCFLGLAVALLSFTGVYIWWKKRRVRNLSERPRSSKADHVETRISDKRRRVETLEQNVLLHLDAAYNLARWLTGNAQDAEDVVQEAFLHAFRFFAGWRGGDARTWLMRIVRNTCYTWLRVNRPLQDRTAFDENAFPPSSQAPHPEEIVPQNDIGSPMRKALEKLSPNCREVLILRELEGMSYREIAQITGMPVGTVMATLARARGRLRQALAGHTRVQRKVRERNDVAGESA